MVEVAVNTPLAEALNAVIQPKLVEVGWSTGGVDDSALSEYIILMLVNGKTQDQIASELSGDLLQLGPDDPGAIEFSTWLFERVDSLHRQLNGDQPSSTNPIAQATAEQSQQNAPTSAVNDSAGPLASGDASQEMEVDEGGDASTAASIPTGPKSMRGKRDKRLVGQLNRAMDRSHDAVLHRVRPQQGTERVNSHSREPPKGPRSGPGRGARVGGGRGAGMMARGGMAQPGASAGLAHMSPQQQMQLLAMYEEQARMMSQILSPQQQQQMFMPPGMAGPGMHGGPGTGFPHVQHQGPSRSLFERVDPDPHPRHRPGPNKQLNPAAGKFAPNGAGAHPKAAREEAMDEESQPAKSETAIADTVCKFNLACTKVDCPYAHQSPAAPPGTTIDVSDNCPFGAACKNFKCVARHPSPGAKVSHQAEQDCKFYPNCTNPTCPFRHPNTPLCRSGADCTRPGCSFTHVKTLCKFNPCLNQACPFKHVDGQKRGQFHDKVWSASGSHMSDNGHVSERKFVDENAGEELIIPGAPAAPDATTEQEIIT